jgi:cytochrome c oxidase subunit 2
MHWPEIIWISIAFVWGLVMFLAMIYWHIEGEQNLSNEAYRITPDAFAEKTEAMAEAYTVREEGETGIPVVHPPPGSEVYMLARLWEMDWQHGFSLQPTNINLQVHPNYEMVLTITPTETGVFGVVCNEFCGIGHHDMVGRIYVVE